jgi:hypothetical protein
MEADTNNGDVTQVLITPTTRMYGVAAAGIAQFTCDANGIAATATLQMMAFSVVA